MQPHETCVMHWLSSSFCLSNTSILYICEKLCECLMRGKCIFLKSTAASMLMLCELLFVCTIVWGIFSKYFEAKVLAFGKTVIYH